MDVIRFLLALHPRGWRDRYGVEFAALLEETPLTAAAVVDVLLHAAKLHAEARRGLLMIAGAALTSQCVEIAALRGHLTANVLWAPTTPARALALAALLAPWAWLAARSASRRRGRLAKEA